jgi:hypothetical protein
VVKRSMSELTRAREETSEVGRGGYALYVQSIIPANQKRTIGQNAGLELQSSFIFKSQSALKGSGASAV